MVGTPGTMTQR